MYEQVALNKYSRRLFYFL